MHVVHIPPSPIRDQEQIFISHQVQSLALRRVKVGIFCPYVYSFRSSTNYDELALHTGDSNLIFQDARRSHLPFRVISPIFRYWLRRKFVYKSFQKYSEQMGKPDLIHSHNTLEGGAIAFLLSKKFGIPYIITEHSSRFLIGETFSYLERLSIKKIWRNTKLLLAVSSSLKRAIERDFECSTEIRVLHNTLEPEFVDRKKIWSVSKSQKILLVSIGRLENIKRHRMLIDAFALINAERQMKLLIFGNGSQEVSLREQIDALGQIGCIEILDGSDRNAMFTKLAQAHAMVHASQYETFGVVLIEALALGVPVLSTNSGGPADFIDGKNGVIVDVSDSRGLAIGISEFLEQIDHFDRKEISENCLKLFGHKVIAEHLAKTYETLVHKR